VSSTFAFSPYGLSQPVTVVPTAGTLTLFLNLHGGTGTLSVTNAAFPPSGLRIANMGAATGFVLFTSPGSTQTIAQTIGMFIGASAIEKFRIQGMNRMLFMSAGGTTTFQITPGEGL